MDDSVFFQLIEKSLEIVHSLDFEGFGDTPSVNAERVMIREAPFEDGDPEQDWKDEPLPCILLTPGNITRPSDAGVNTLDDVTYRVLYQIVDRHERRVDLDRMRSHMLWTQRIARSHHGYSWASIDFDGGCPIISWSEETRIIDPRVFWTHRYFVRGTIINFVSREPRTIS